MADRDGDFSWNRYHGPLSVMKTAWSMSGLDGDKSRFERYCFVIALGSIGHLIFFRVRPVCRLMRCHAFCEQCLESRLDIASIRLFCLFLSKRSFIALPASWMCSEAVASLYFIEFVAIVIPSWTASFPKSSWHSPFPGVFSAVWIFCKLHWYSLCLDSTSSCC